MKVAIVSASVTRRSGGIRDSLLGFTQELVRSPDTEVRVLTLAEPDVESDFRRWAQVPLRTFPIRGITRLGYAPGLVQGLREADPELVHTHAIWMYPSAAVAAWHEETRRPYLVSPHGMLDPWATRHSPLKKRLAYLLYERRHLERAHCFHALCESEAQAIRAFGLKAPIAIIPNGIDLAEHTTAAATLLPDDGSAVSALRAGGRKIALSIGRLHPKKGLVNLLRAWSAVSKAMPGEASGWVLIIAGWDQGGHEQELKRLATDLEISWAETGEAARSNGATGGDDSRAASVVFVGPQFNDAKTRCYASCDAFILPSFSEGLPMAVLEAWAYGKPVLMTRECNLPEGFSAGAAIEARPEEQSLAAGLRSLFTATDAERQAMGARGLALVRKQFVWDQIAAKLRAVYAWTLGGGTRPECVLLA